eukprot:gene13803-15248_t
MYLMNLVTGLILCCSCCVVRASGNRRIARPGDFRLPAEQIIDGGRNGSPVDFKSKFRTNLLLARLKQKIRKEARELSQRQGKQLSRDSEPDWRLKAVTSRELGREEWIDRQLNRDYGIALEEERRASANDRRAKANSNRLKTLDELITLVEDAKTASEKIARNSEQSLMKASGKSEEEGGMENVARSTEAEFPQTWASLFHLREYEDDAGIDEDDDDYEEDVNADGHQQSEKRMQEEAKEELKSEESREDDDEDVEEELEKLKDIITRFKNGRGNTKKKETNLIRPPRPG